MVVPVLQLLGGLLTWALQGGIFVTCAYDQPLANWPIIPGNEGFDLVSNDTSFDPYGPLNIYSEDGYGYLDYSCTRFTGQSNSYIDLKMPNVSIKDSLGITMLFQPVDITNGGTLFHYKVDDISTVGDDEFYEIRAYFDHENFTIQVWNTTAVIQELIAPHTELLVGSWISFAVNNEWKAKKLQYFINKTKEDNTISTEFPLPASPGTFRVGAGFDPALPYLDACVSCFQVYPKKFADGDFQKAHDNCMSTTWPATVNSFERTLPVYTPPPPLCYNQRYYELLAQGQTPDTLQPPFYQTTARSDIDCARECTLNNTCVSFVMTSLSMCSLYDDDYSDSLKAAPGLDYYVKTIC